ncbi:flagellar biosynthesis protein FlhB [Halomonas cupida]|uniref:Flagellar biosynthetic protein FlhB n=1 Tax=Halomonas cupida TaxID=44933 RepID=A0A1M7G6F4_9GAMM|nr:flagellar biosynthesis protein FlhB [Halomonas cupida]GEN23670.1 flagellar biosynthesis protein FlhB [Halomonas cupida]SHM11841.1 flagellar biosynthetic protein FlhB [Halomonas cupida]
MAEQSSDQEKTEPASPRRLEKAREEGQVARSRELATFTLLLGGVVGLWSTGALLYDQLGGVMEQAFLFERREAMETMPMLSQALSLGQRSLFSLIPLFALLTLIALLSPALLGGWLFSSKSLKPQISRLNPLKGLQRMFSSQALAELAKAIAKASLVGGVGVYFLYRHRGEALGLMKLPVPAALTSALELIAIACALMVMTLIVVILIDVPYQLWSHAKKLRMSKEEVKQEFKEAEGDPHIKGRIRQQQQAIARGRMMSQVPSADVVVTNPTHFAVALAWNEGNMGAPRVVAKGIDAVAARIRDVASEAGVPLLEAPPLARTLYQHVDLDREIPIDLYNAVAEVLAWAFSLKRAASEGSAPPPTPDAIEVPDSLAVPAANDQGTAQ